MNRRTFVAVALGAIVDSLIGSATRVAYAVRLLRIPVTIDNGTTKRTYVMRLQERITLLEALDRVADRYGLLHISGTNPTWQHPEMLIGYQLLQVGTLRNNDMPEIRDIPSETLDGHYWMIFVGPTKEVIQRERRQLIRQVPPEGIVNLAHLLLGPTASIATTHLLNRILDARRSCPPQLYIKYTLPNGPF